MIKVVLVGAGYIAEHHLQAYRQVPGAQVVAVADVDAGRAARLAAMAGGVPWAADYREVLARGDAVDICTPSARHAEVGLAAAALGKALHVEKPFALSLADAERLLDACARAGVPVMAGQTERFSQLGRMLKEVVDGGDIGRLVLARITRSQGQIWPGGWQGWQFDPAESGGIFLHLGIHTLDLLLWLFDAPARSIYAQTQKRASSAMDMCDYYQCVVKFQDERSAIAELSYALPRPGDKYRAALLVGTAGSASYNLAHDAFLLDAGGLQFVDEGLDPPLARQLAHFVECVETGTPPVTTPAQIRAALRLALAAEESAGAGRAVEL